MLITYLCPSWHNLGDKVIYLGARQLMKKRFPEALHSVCLYPWEDVPETDILVVCGTPWVWDQCGPSEKYRALEKALCRASTACKIGLGLGSCYPLEMSVEDALGSAKALSGLWGQFSELEVRDRFAYDVFTRCGLSVQLRPCPSWWACEDVKANPTRPLIIPVDPYHCVATEGLTGPELTSLDHQWRNWFRLLPSAKVVTVGLRDQEYVSGLGRQAELIRQDDPFSSEEETVNRLLSAIASASFLVTSRIHAAIPALSLGIPTTIIPLDTRALTVLVRPS